VLVTTAYYGRGRHGCAVCNRAESPRGKQHGGKQRSRGPQPRIRYHLCEALYERRPRGFPPISFASCAATFVHAPPAVPRVFKGGQVNKAVACKEGDETGSGRKKKGQRPRGRKSLPRTKSSLSAAFFSRGLQLPIVAAVTHLPANGLGTAIAGNEIPLKLCQRYPFNNKSEAVRSQPFLHCGADFFPEATFATPIHALANRAVRRTFSCEPRGGTWVCLRDVLLASGAEGHAGPGGGGAASSAGRMMPRTASLIVG
jgi:hypothetical protein